MPVPGIKVPIGAEGGIRGYEGFSPKLHGTTPSGWTLAVEGIGNVRCQVREVSGTAPALTSVSLLDSWLPEPPVVAGSPLFLSAWFELPQCCFGMLLADQCAAAPVELDADRRFAADITGFFHRGAEGMRSVDPDRIRFSPFRFFRLRDSGIAEYERGHDAEMLGDPELIEQFRTFGNHFS